MQPTALAKWFAPRLMPDVIRTEQERLRIVFRSGRLRHFARVAALGCFARVWHVAASGRASAFRSPLRQPAKDRSHLAAAAIGVTRIMSASTSWQPGLSISGARPCGVEHRRFSHRFTVGGQAVAGGPVAGLAHSHRSESARFRQCCAALGAVRSAGAIARVSRWRGLIRAPYNTRWSRRARQSGAILSLRRAAQRER